MSTIPNENNKYPISKNGYQCIGPCHAPNTYIIHPNTLDIYISTEQNSCPINSTLYSTHNNPDEKKILHMDVCHDPSILQNSLISDIGVTSAQHITTPSLTLGPALFLRNYYDIRSFEEGVDWLDRNMFIPYRTRERVFNQLMIKYGDDFSVADHRIVAFIRDIMLHNLSVIFEGIGKYINIQGDKIVITIPKDGDIKPKLNKKQIHLVELYIKTKFIGESEVNHFISKFLRYKPEDMNKPRFSKIIVHEMIKHVIDRITLTYKKKS